MIDRDRERERERLLRSQFVDSEKKKLKFHQNDRDTSRKKSKWKKSTQAFGIIEKVKIRENKEIKAREGPEGERAQTAPASARGR